MEQIAFKDWIDKIDDMLLEWMTANQGQLGKANLTRDQVAMMQKRGFKSRVSNRTGKSYPEAMTVRYKASAFGSDEVLVWDREGNPYTKEIQMNDIVAVIMKYEGCYVKPGQYFGNSWTLMGVLFLGSAIEESKEVAPEPENVVSMFETSTSMSLPMN